MSSFYHIRIYSDETLQSHRQNTRNTTLFIAPLADVMHCQVLGGQRGGTAGDSAAAATLYKGAWPSPAAPAYPVAAELTSTARRTWRRRAVASFYFCLRPVPEATVGCRPPTPTDVRCSAAPNTNFFLHSNFVKQCGEQVNNGK